MADNKFGGPWTKKKLDILRKYLSFYPIALGGKFTLHYADAFAGTGKLSPKQEASQRELLKPDQLIGSAKAALDLDPGFDHYHFNDINEEFVEDLNKLKEANPTKSIRITHSDANEFVKEFCNSLQKNDRAVLFLDPFSTELNWSTLKFVAESEKTDLWMLFPISVIIRMTPKNGAKIKPEWSRTLNRLLGTDEWQKALYAPKEKPRTDDLFAEEIEDSSERINVEELEKWISNRLAELFPFVANPVKLYNKRTILFLFYFSVSNPSPKAKALAIKVVNNILKAH